MTRPDPDMAKLIAQAAGLGADHMIPLLRAAREGLIHLASANRADPFPHRDIARVRLPTVFLLGDDDDQSTGPSGFRSAEDALGWAKMGMVHAASATPEQYAQAVVKTVNIWRLVLVETDAAHFDAWMNFIQAKAPAIPIVAFIATDGVHPVPVSKGALH